MTDHLPDAKKMMAGYRRLKPGEVILSTDEYESVFTPGVYTPVKECSVGVKILPCNVPYYRRKLAREVQL